jgi:hypothetical protein
MPNSTYDRKRITDWLESRGAVDIPHPGGTLFDHLNRVADRMHRLGLAPHVQAAGRTHAAYGTDGFDVTLLDLGQRATLRDLVGVQAEELVYLYGSCDRSRTWTALPQAKTVWDRFTGGVQAPSTTVLRAFVDLTILNELDVVEHSPAVAAAHGADLRELFGSWLPLCSPEVRPVVTGWTGAG